MNKRPTKFTIKCSKCGSLNTEVNNDITASDNGDGTLDTWGSIFIYCKDCKEMEEMYTDIGI